MTDKLDSEKMFEMTIYDNLNKEIKEFVISTSFFTIDEFGFVVDDEGKNVTIDQIEEQKIYYENGEL